MTYYIPSFHFLRPTLCAASLLLLAACAAESDFPGMSQAEYEQRYAKHIRVEQHVAEYPLMFDAKRGTLSSYDENQFKGFLTSFSPMSAERVAVAGALNDTQQLYVTRLIRASGYPKSVISYQDEASRAIGTAAEVHILYHTASVPNCPEWIKPSDHNYSNTLGSNFGCASNRNLSNMVVAPQDLLRGKGKDAPVNETNSRAIQNYLGGSAAASTTTSTSTSSAASTSGAANAGVTSGASPGN